MKWLRVAGVLMLIGGCSSLAGAGERGPVQRRALSLRVLQAKLKEAAPKGRATRDLMELAGITRVTGYVVDEKRRDLILLGEVEGGAPALHTEDLAVAFRSAWMKYARRQGRTIYYEDPGCSIDPNPEVIRQLSEIGQDQVDEPAMDQWCAICDEPQEVRVMGVPFDSRFAKVMVDADYLMKRLVDGSVDPGIAGFQSLSGLRQAKVEERLAKGASSSGGLSMNRFWFYPGEAKFHEEEGVVSIDACPVTLLTEEQHLTREGVKGLKRPDPLAQQFAESFTAHYAEIAEQRPIYTELEELLRLSALAKLVKYQQERVDLDLLMNRLAPPTVKVDRTLPGISRVLTVERRRDTADGYETLTMWMPSCGGVNMGLKIGPRNFKRTTPRASGGKGAGGLKQQKGRSGSKLPKQSGPRSQQPSKKSSVLKARPAPDSLSWDLGPEVRWQ